MAFPTANLAQAFTFPLDSDRYALNGGYDFLEWSNYHRAWHPGEDWNLNNDLSCDAERGDDVFAVANGRIVAAGHFGHSWGNAVLIEHILPNGNKVWSQYAHLQAIARVNGHVRLGEKIGEIGSGSSECAHLHWEIRTSDLPVDFWPRRRNRAWIAEHYVDPTDFVIVNMFQRRWHLPR